MCGICGMFTSDPEKHADRDLLNAMNETLIHRGPDDSGMYVDGPIGLAMRRLSIIDVTGGRQPMTEESESLWIVFNGEIYNFLELREDLVSRGHVFKTKSDTEVILRLYQEIGVACVEKLNGMFAFAIWDAGKQTIFMARDRLGIKPLFYAFSPEGDFYFGSEIKALLKTPIDLRPDFQAIYDYLSLMYVPTPATAYTSIRKLPPGCFCLVSSRDVDIQKYWEVPLPAEWDVDTSYRNYEDEVLGLLETAVRRQMISDVEIGAFLSGGLDSTTVTAIMVDKLKKPMRTFTIGFNHKSYDESAEARLVAEKLGTDHIEQTVYPSMIKSIPDLLNFFDEPFADYSAIPTFLVSQLASKKLKVVLTGDGGDEVFAGYPTHTAYRVTDAYKKIPGFIRNRVITPLVQRMPTSMNRLSFDYKAKRFVTGADLPMEQGHYWWKVIFNEDEKKELLNPDFSAAKLDTYRVFEQYFDQCRHSHPLNRLLFVDLKTFLLDDNLVKVDRMTMANSLEARVPFLDHELVEKVALMPPLVKSKGLETKGLLRRAVRDLLPPAIRSGTKKGFTPPLPLWISAELKSLFEEYFSHERLSAIRILNPTYCRKLLHDHFQGKKDNNRQLWTLLALICRLEKTPL